MWRQRVGSGTFESDAAPNFPQRYRLREDIMSDTIKVGDYVIPWDDDDEFDNRHWTPCKVTAVYKNGSLYARSDVGNISWRGPTSGFRVVSPTT